MAASILDNTSLAASEPVAVATDILSVEIWIVSEEPGREAIVFWAGRHFKFFSRLSTDQGSKSPL